jgi:hypothetical protein
MSKAWALSGILFALSLFFLSEWLAFIACFINGIAGVASDACTEIGFESVSSYWQVFRKLCEHFWPENGLIYWLVARRILILAIVAIFVNFVK